MILEKGYIYHIYNQGNNKQKIFFNQENYRFFLRKVRENLLPYADLLAYCLMPNHFHFMIYLHSEIVIRSSTEKECDINQAIGIMLRSYTRAINKQENRTGSLFREDTKAINLSKPEGITPAWFENFGVTMINVSIPEKEYPNVCYNYILENPVKSRLVQKATDWEFSSARDMAGLRNGTLINKQKISNLVKI